MVYQVNDNGSSANARTTWISAGLRPIRHFTKHLSLAFEVGGDYVNSEPNNYSGYLYKFTVAPQIAIDNLFYAQPVIRLFATVATWSDDSDIGQGAGR